MPAVVLPVRTVWIRYHMVRLSTILILAGIVLIVAPVPPIGITLGPIALVLGILLRIFTDL